MLPGVLIHLCGPETLSRSKDPLSVGNPKILSPPVWKHPRRWLSLLLAEQLDSLAGFVGSLPTMIGLIWPMVSNPPGRCNSPISDERLSEEFVVDGSEVGQTIRLGDMPREVLGPETNGE